jgi:hypothetical protein
VDGEEDDADGRWFAFSFPRLEAAIAAELRFFFRLQRKNPARAAMMSTTGMIVAMAAIAPVDIPSLSSPLLPPPEELEPEPVSEGELPVEPAVPTSVG